MNTSYIRPEEEGREIYKLLQAAGHETFVAFRRFSNPPNEPLTSARALLYLHAVGVGSVKQLAKALSTSVSWASRLVDALTKQRLVESTRGQLDRRLVQVKLTKKGTRIAQRLSVHLHGPFADALREIQPQERLVIKQFLRQFTAKLNGRETNAALVG